MEFEVIILAAGRGTRLEEKTRDIPKCLLEVKPGISLLDTQLISLLRYFPKSKITIAVGYKAEKIAEHIQKKYSVANITLLPIISFEKYNNAHTLKQALIHRTPETGVLQINSDVFFEPSILADVENKIQTFSATEARVFVQEKTCGEEEMKIVLNTSGSIATINKKIDPILSLGEAFGINFYGANFIDNYILALTETIEKSPQAYFEDALDLLFSRSEVGTVHRIRNRVAIEVDFSEDLEAVRQNFPLFESLF